VENATIRAILNELRECHGESLARWDTDLDEDVSRTLDLLPEPEGWAVAQNEPLAVSHNNKMLFRVRLDTERKLIAVNSRPLRVEKLAVIFNWGEESRDDETRELVRATSWLFFDVDEGERTSEDALRIDGAVRITSRGVERPDDRERFARSLAGEAGWGTVY
jgi:hypothetical protein